MIQRKILQFQFILIGCLGLFTNTIFAASSSVYASWKVYSNGQGVVSGKSTGEYHKLTGGKYAYLKVSSRSGSGTPKGSLYRSIWGLDTYYGEVEATTGTHKFKAKKADATSSKYYLEFYGGKHDTNQHITGKLYN